MAAPFIAKEPYYPSLGGYFAVSSGTITDEAIMEYIKHQNDDEEKRGDGFTVVDSGSSHSGAFREVVHFENHLR